MDRVAGDQLPSTMGYEWTELSFQELLAEKDLLAKLVFPLAVLFVFMVLAAQYESWSLPLAILLIVPMCLLSALIGLWMVGLDNNIFAQIGFVVLIGLAAKNAILVVEFSKQLEDAGKSRVEAVVEASRTRLRPILMTAFAFILGVVPLAVAKGAGAEMRVPLGVAVFSGMLGVTFFGLVFTPVFYSIIMRFAGKEPLRARSAQRGARDRSDVIRIRAGHERYHDFHQSSSRDDPLPHRPGPSGIGHLSSRLAQARFDRRRVGGRGGLADGDRLRRDYRA